jgi:hypothetical protein
MKATLKFTLPEEQNEFEIASNATKYYSALWEIHYICRRVWKYEDNTASKDRIELAEEINNLISELSLE